jgi:GNAT superfamily N-acetyltransferase
MREGDLMAADHVMRLAFGTFLGLPEPATFMGDAGFVRPRWRTDPSAAFAAESAGDIVGSNFASHWGSVGFFGPLTTRPDLWDRGIGQLLMEPVMDCFARWQTTHAGLFTFAHSQKHLALYQRFGFWPRFLTAVMSKSVTATDDAPACSRFSDLDDGDRHSALSATRALTDAVFGTCYVKFGAVRPGCGADSSFRQLLDAIELLADSRGLSRVVAGVNTSRQEAYCAMLECGFRADIQGVAMHRPNTDGYSRAGLFVIDDWR